MFTIKGIKNVNLWISHELGRTVEELIHTIMYGAPEEYIQKVLVYKDSPELRSSIGKRIRELRTKIQEVNRQLDSYDVFVATLQDIKSDIIAFMENRGVRWDEQKDMSREKR